MKISVALRVSLAMLSILLALTLAALPGIFGIYYLYRILSIGLFLILLAPALVFAYFSFIVLLGVFLSQFRKIIPLVKEGVYDRESPERVYYEIRVFFYHAFVDFVVFFKQILHNPLIHNLFGGKIGKGTMVDNKLLNPEFIEIGENCSLGLRCIIGPRVYEKNNIVIKKVKIGDNCTIGGQSTILLGAEIGDNAVIGINAFIGKDKKIPPGTVWIGAKTQQLKKKA